MIDGQKRLVEATLEAKRAEGAGKHVVALVYDAGRFTSHLNDAELVRRCFKKRGSDGSVVDCVCDVELALAEQGVSCLDARGDRQGLADRLANALSWDDRAVVGAGCAVVFVRSGAVIDVNLERCSFPDEIVALTRRGRVLSDEAIPVLKDNPHLWHDLMNPALDRFRPFIPRNEDARKKLRELGDAALKVGGHGLVEFNVASSFRTAEAVAADLHATRSVEINR